MALTRDLILRDKSTVQLGVFPKLGLIIINDLRDFAENWIEIIVTRESRHKMDMSIRTLSGHGDGGIFEGVCRYFIETILKNSKESFEFEAEKLGQKMKFIVNINLNVNITNDRLQIKEVGEALVSLLSN